MLNISLNISVFIVLCGAILAQEIREDFYANSNVYLPKGNKYDKLYFTRVMFFHYIHGVIIVLVIIKIALAIGFVGMLSVMTRMFAAIKYLFQDTAKSKEPTPTYITIPHHHSHEIEYDFPGHDEHKYHHRRQDPKKGAYSKDGPNQGYYRSGYTGGYGSRIRQDLSGGRSLGNDAAYSVQVQENKERTKRDLEKILNADNEILKERVDRSAESPDENCMKKRVCMLHARAREDPMFIFQLFFLKKDGLAKYWDHDTSKSFKDCINAFPCNPKIKESEKQKEVKTTQLPTTTEKKILDESSAKNQEVKYFTDQSGSSSVEYESSLSSQNQDDDQIILDD